MALDVLFIGGTGQISLPCVELAVKAGHKVSVFNRGIRDEKLPRKVKVIAGDMKDEKAYRNSAGQGGTSSASSWCSGPSRCRST